MGIMVIDIVWILYNLGDGKNDDILSIHHMLFTMAYYIKVVMENKLFIK